MSNYNKPKLKADHGQHSDTQPPKKGRRGFIGFISLMGFMLMFLLIASCQPVNAQTFKQLEVSNHDHKK